MKRQLTKPVVVEHRRRPSASAPATAPRQPAPDRRIRTWSADAPAPEPTGTPTYTEILQQHVALWVARLRGANDPAIHQEAAEAMAYRAEAERAAASMIVTRHPRAEGETLTLTAKPGQSGLLVKIMQKLMPGVPLIRGQDYDREARKKKGKL
jgi:hypothetical protein